MESIISYPNSDIPHKYGIDGSELYGEDGQTIADISEIENINEILDKKRAAKAAK